MKIEWKYPEPKGLLDRFVGPGATKAEITLQFASAFIFGFIILSCGIKAGWGLTKLVVGALLAFDLMGGVVTNATSAAKRWYHRQGMTFVEHYAFVALHAVQIFLAVWAFKNTDWGFFFAVYAYLMFSAYVVLKCPLYLQRPVAGMMFAFSFLIIVKFGNIPGLEWFVPMLFFKLLVSHCLYEEPYRPDTEEPQIPEREPAD